MYPADCKYTKDHEWIKVTGETGQVGITDYAQKQLGDVVYLDLPAVGRALTVGESFGTVESVKAVSELYSPVAGVVTAVNSALAEKPERRQQRPARELDDRGQACQPRRPRRAPVGRAVFGTGQVGQPFSPAAAAPAAGRNRASLHARPGPRRRRRPRPWVR